MSALNSDEYTLFTSSFAKLIASDAPPTTDDELEKHTASICMAGTPRYSDLSPTDLNRVSCILLLAPGTSFLTTMPPVLLLFS